MANSFTSSDGNQSFTFQVVPDSNALEIKLELPEGAGSFGGEDTLAVNRTIGIVPNVLAKDEITNWWWFNESLGRLASDSVGDNHGDLLGGMKWARMQWKALLSNSKNPGK